MPATIYFVRHAQGIHNLSTSNEAIPDPTLTVLGKEQCAGLRNRFQHHDKITHLVASPMRRTIQTCLEAFEPSDGKQGLPIVVLSEIQEVSDAPCDTGSHPRVLKDEFGDKVDLSRVAEGWNDKSEATPWEPTFPKVEARAREARRILREIAREVDDAHMVVVLHGAIIHFVTDDWSGIEPPRATSWDNAEVRSFQFVDTTGQDPDAKLLETDESWEARLGKGTPRPTDAEQQEGQKSYYTKVGAWLKWTPDREL